MGIQLQREIGNGPEGGTSPVEQAAVGLETSRGPEFHGLGVRGAGVRQPHREAYRRDRVLWESYP